MIVLFPRQLAKQQGFALQLAKMKCHTKCYLQLATQCLLRYELQVKLPRCNIAGLIKRLFLIDFVSAVMEAASDCQGFNFGTLRLWHFVGSNESKNVKDIS